MGRKYGGHKGWVLLWLLLFWNLLIMFDALDVDLDLKIRSQNTGFKISG